MTFALIVMSQDDNGYNEELIGKLLEARPGRRDMAPTSLSLTNRISFPMKLFQMLEDTERDGNEWICSWSEDCKSFKVHNTAAFVAKIMPQYFRQTRYKSFQRQCHLYGYTRLTSGIDRGNYCHPKFIKNNRDLCREMIPLKRMTQFEQQNKEKPRSKKVQGNGPQDRSNMVALSGYPWAQVSSNFQFHLSEHQASVALGASTAVVDTNAYKAALQQMLLIKCQADGGGLQTDVDESASSSHLPQSWDTAVGQPNEFFPPLQLFPSQPALNLASINLGLASFEQSAVLPLIQGRSSMCTAPLTFPQQQPDASLKTDESRAPDSSFEQTLIETQIQSDQLAAAAAAASVLECDSVYHPTSASAVAQHQFPDDFYFSLLEPRPFPNDFN